MFSSFCRFGRDATVPDRVPGSRPIRWGGVGSQGSGEDSAIAQQITLLGSVTFAAELA